jgi:hypothetical protein
MRLVQHIRYARPRSRRLTFAVLFHGGLWFLLQYGPCSFWRWEIDTGEVDRFLSLARHVRPKGQPLAVCDDPLEDASLVPHEGESVWPG